VAQVGSARRVSTTIEEYYRYHVLKLLADEGMFEFLREPRTYGEIVAKFGYEEGDYSRELLKVLAEDKRNVLVEQDGRYRANGAHSPPTLEELLAQTDSRYQQFSNLARDLTQNVPARLRHEPVEFTDNFEQEGREMLPMFDDLLGNLVYTVSRQTAFALLPRKVFRWLHGKRLLDIGCGPGREPAEMWLKLGGDVSLVGVDPVGSFVQAAERSFALLLDKLDSNHPPLTDTNQPTFREASATQLPFEDSSFDAAFHSHMLHWTADPRRAINEIVRVLKPGGLVFGMQTCKPYVGPYAHIVIRSNENCYGYFWREEFKGWYEENGIPLDIATPGGAFWGKKPE
jgi:ubiquinone/menaquinone biosynthesis C-methylase UbiE